MTASFPHRPNLLLLVRDATHYYPLRPGDMFPPDERHPDDKEYIHRPSYLEPGTFPLTAPVIWWRALFGRLDDLRTLALAAGDHEAVLLVDVLRILVNLPSGPKRDRFEFALHFLMDELGGDCDVPDGHGPC